MSKSEKTSHWKSLAALLGTDSGSPTEPAESVSDPGAETAGSEHLPPGASSSPPVVQTPNPSPLPPRSTPPKSPAPKSAAPRPPSPRRESHWGKLAGVLGLAGAPAQPEPIAAEPIAAEPIAAEPIVPEPVAATRFQAEQPVEAEPAEWLPEPRVESRASESRASDYHANESVHFTPSPSESAKTSDAAAMAAAHWDADDRDHELVDPLEMRGEPFIDEALNSVDIESIDGPSTTRAGTDSESSTEERHRRRRRRRGRGRGRRLDSEPAPAGESATPSTEDFVEPIIGAEAATEVESGPMEPLDEAEAERPFRLEGPSDKPAAGQTEEEHRRRRRRRRGRRGRSDDRSASAEGPARPRAERAPRDPDRQPERPSERQPERRPERQPDRLMERTTERVPEHSDADLGDCDDDSLYALVHEEELDEEGKTDDDLHLSHKKIPSWEDAVESVIAANMASRANNPSSGSRGRGRGHRDR